MDVFDENVENAVAMEEVSKVQSVITTSKTKTCEVLEDFWSEKEGKGTSRA